MKQTLSLLLFLVTSFGCSAQGWEWAREPECGGSNGSNEFGSEGWLIKIDDSGYIYAAGCNFSDSICFGSYKFHFPIPYKNQPVLIKYDSIGNIIWATTSDEGAANPQDFTIDKQGNIYLYGDMTTDSIRFGSHLLVNPNYVDTEKFNACPFIIKYNSNGNVVWVVNGENNNPVGYYYGSQSYGGIVADLDANIYVWGRFNDSAVSFSNHTLTNNLSGRDDIFLIKYDSSGQLKWAKSFGGKGDDFTTSIAISNQAEIYAMGNFNSPSIKFGNTTLNYSGALPVGAASSHNVFLCKFDTAGNVIWVISPKGNACGYGLAVDQYSDVYIGGKAEDTTLVFDAYTLVAPYQKWGAFFAKYNASGVTAWAKSLNPAGPPGVISRDVLYAITIDSCSNVWVSGGMTKSAGMMLDSITTLTPALPHIDPFFLAQYTSGGTLVDYLSLPTGGDDNSGLVADHLGNIYLVDDYGWVDPFILGNDTLHPYHDEDERFFIAKYHSQLNCNLFAKETSAPFSLVTLYPNPATSTLTIQYNNTDKATASIYDITGRLMGSYALTSTTTISVQTLPPGIYQCRIMDGQQHVVTRKLVIIR